MKKSKITIIMLTFILLSWYFFGKDTALAEEIWQVMSFQKDCIEIFTPLLIELSQTMQFMHKYGIIIIVDKETGIETVFRTSFYMENLHNGSFARDFLLNKPITYWETLLENNYELNENQEIVIDNSKLWNIICEDYESYVKNEHNLMGQELENIDMKSYINKTKEKVKSFLFEFAQKNCSEQRKAHIGTKEYINDFVEKIDWENYVKTWDYKSGNIQYIKQKYLNIQPQNSYYFYDFINTKMLQIANKTKEIIIENSDNAKKYLTIFSVFYLKIFLTKLYAVNQALGIEYDLEIITPGAKKIMNAAREIRITWKFYQSFGLLVLIGCFIEIFRAVSEKNNTETEVANNTVLNSPQEHVENVSYYKIYFSVIFLIILNIITFYPFRYYYYFRLKLLYVYLFNI